MTHILYFASRYFYDPPEMQSLVCEMSYSRGLHLGYFRSHTVVYFLKRDFNV